VHLRFVVHTICEYALSKATKRGPACNVLSAFLVSDPVCNRNIAPPFQQSTQLSLALVIFSSGREGLRRLPCEGANLSDVGDLASQLGS
jgi:hypothetical protein